MLYYLGMKCKRIGKDVASCVMISIAILGGYNRWGFRYYLSTVATLCVEPLRRLL
jgi:hypothetical protein